MRNVLIACLLLAASAAHAQSPTVPSQAELKTLTRDSMLAFSKGVEAKDFTTFHKQISQLWREQITPAKLKSSFAVFTEQNIDISPVTKLDPIFDPPAAIDSDDVLVIQGRYPTEPTPVQFRLKYVNEKSTWKLIGIKVDVVSPSSKVPNAREARALALESLLAFNRAVQAKNFTTFHKQIASVWQKEITPAQLRKVFSDFVDQGVDIGDWISDLQPIFDPAPALDENEFLLLKGYYPTKPNRLQFKLRYIEEEGAWQLISIGVNISPEGEAQNEDE